MKKNIFWAFILLASETAYAGEELSFKRTAYHFNMGYTASTFGILGFENLESGIAEATLGHGGQVAFDWQGKGRLGFQIPLSYSYHPNVSFHEIDFGGNLMVHFNKRDKAFDPYFAVGLKWLGGFSGGEEENITGGVFPYPFLNTGLGIRHFFTPHVGIYGEVAASNLAFLFWQVEGKVGVSFGF